MLLSALTILGQLANVAAQGAGSSGSPSPAATDVSSSAAGETPAASTLAANTPAASTPAASPVQSSAAGSSGAGAAGASASMSLTASVSTAIPSSTEAPDTPVRGQDVLPPPQWWCTDNAPYCPGRLLQNVELAEVFPDSKTFVDKPTNGSLNDTLNAFEQLGTNVTVGGVATFASEWFKGEGLELEPVEIEGFNPNPRILDNVVDPLYKAWVQVVHGYWTLLIRQTNQSALCQPGPDGCTSSLIPLNNTIVVPGGRYREVYYWDSYWILQGLLASELHTYAWNLLQNFMDLIEDYGFIPNGGRKYYLNRSQPPVFAQMVHAYVIQTGNTTILERALPILDAELEWWSVNRTIDVVSPFTNKTHSVAHFAVVNSAPRPEGYVEDWTTAFGAAGETDHVALNETQRSDLYAELASGAESGWDYSSRWCREPLLNKTDNNPTLRTLNVRGIAPVDLNALLSADHHVVAELYELFAGAQNGTGAGGGGSGEGGNVTTQAGGTDVQASSSAAPTQAWRRQEEPAGADPALTIPANDGDSASDALTADGTTAAQSPGAETPAAETPAAETPNEMSSAPTPAAETTAAESPAQTPAPTPVDSAMPHPSESESAIVPPAPETTGTATGGTGTGGSNTTSHSDKAAAHRAKAEAYKAAVLDLHWDASRAYFYDYNISSSTHSPVYSPAGLWPLWLNITPPGLEGNESMALAIASGQRFILGKYPGVPSVATLLESGLNWDFPNVWPPHVYTTIKAFETIGRLVPNATILPNITIPYSEVAPSQLNVDEAALPAQPPETIGNTSLFTEAKEPWPRQLSIEIANRYLTDAFCSWYSTGGAIDGVLEQLPLSDLNATGTWTPDQAGHMFEKFNVTDPDAAGGGGEYTVQIGFGWTNGVVLWAAGKYGQFLGQPTCPLIPIVSNEPGNTTSATGSASGSATPATSPAAAASNATTPAGNATAPAASPSASTAAMFHGYRIPRR